MKLNIEGKVHLAHKSVFTACQDSLLRSEYIMLSVALGNVFQRLPSQAL